MNGRTAFDFYRVVSRDGRRLAEDVVPGLGMVVPAPVHSKTWVRLMRISASHPLGEVSSRPDQNTPPALFTKRAGVPSFSTVAARAASTCSASRTSVTHARPSISRAADVAV